MANYKYDYLIVQQINDREHRPNAWGVYGKIKDRHRNGGETELISDHRRKKPATIAAFKKANKGQRIGIKKANGQWLRWTEGRKD